MPAPHNSRKVARALKMVGESRLRMNTYSFGERKKLYTAALRKVNKRYHIEACALLASVLSPSAARIARRVFHELNKLTSAERQKIRFLEQKCLSLIQYL